MKSKGWKWGSRPAAAVLLCLAMLIPVAQAGAAQGGAKKFPFPDTSLAGTGAADLTPLLSSPALVGRPISYAPTPSGAVWLGTSRQTCAGNECLTSSYLSRLNSKGELVTTLGEEGSLGYLATGRTPSAVVSDAEGRAVTVSIDAAGLVSVRRFLPTGALDTSFGSGGVSSFSCGCQSGSDPQLSVSVDGSGRILAGVVVTGFGAPTFGMLVTARLLPDGSLDQGFATGGILRTAEGEKTLFSPSGGLFNFPWNLSVHGVPTLERYSQKGILDSSFDARANQALSKASREGSGPFAAHVLALRVRGHGMIDLFLSFGETEGVLRLRSSGAAETKFGKDGVKTLPRRIIQILPGAEGKTLALTVAGAEGVALTRFLNDYRLDPSFGKQGSTALSGFAVEEGFAITPASKGRVTIVDRGAHFCRSACAGGATPKLFRYRAEKGK